jgi:hypothetical protein
VRIEEKLADLEQWRAAMQADKEPQGATGSEAPSVSQDPVIVAMSEQTKRMNLRLDYAEFLNYNYPTETALVRALTDKYFELKAKGY